MDRLRMDWTDAFDLYVKVYKNAILEYKNITEKDSISLDKMLRILIYLHTMEWNYVKGR